MIKLIDLHKSYKLKKGKSVEALKGITVELPDKGMVFILGKSGSGKSTFLNVVGGLDSFDKGDMFLFGKSAKDFTPYDFNGYRNKYIGFIFQEYNILNSFTVFDNVALAYQLKYGKTDKEKVNSILEKVGILDLSERKPSEISGGQKQRVAIARALVKDPKVILADEPTGALDGTNSKEIFSLLRNLSKECLVVCVTHDASCAETYADRIIRLQEGKIVDDITRAKEEIKPIEGTNNIYKVGNGLLKIKDLNDLKSNDIEAIKEESKGYEGYSYLTTKEKVRLPVDLLANDDSSDMPVGFKETSDKDIDENIVGEEKYNAKNGRIPFFTILKMAMNSLKSGWIRLVFTFILSIISFTFLGLSIGVTTYNPSSTFASAGDIFLGSATPLRKTLENDESEMDGMFNEDDLSLIRKEYPNAIPSFRTTKVNLKQNVSLDDLKNKDSYLQQSVYYVSPLESMEQIQDYRGLSFVEGSRLPTKDDEIVVTSYFAYIVNSVGLNDGSIKAGELSSSDQYGKLIGKKILAFNGDSTTFTITGVIQTDLDEETIKEAFDQVSPDDNSKEALVKSYVDFSSSDNGRNTGLETEVFFAPSLFSKENINKLNIISPDENNIISKIMVPTNDKDSLNRIYKYSKNDVELNSKDSYYEEKGFTYKNYNVSSYVASKLDSSFMGLIGNISTYSTYIAIGIGIIAALTTMNFLFTSVSFKKQDIGILKGLGSTSRDVFAIFVLEGLLIAFVNFVISLVLTFILMTPLNSFLIGLTGIAPLSLISFNWVQVLVIFLLAFGVSIFSALIPSYTIANMKPVDAMKRNE